MTVQAPDLYALDGRQLAEEMKHITVVHSEKVFGPVTIITGTRRDQISDLTAPVTIIKSEGRSPMHLLIVPADD